MEQRDQAYRDVLKSWNGLEAVWRQQPENLAALERSGEHLQARLQALRRSVDKSTPTPTKGAGQAQKTTVSEPTGPVAPSGIPSPPAEVELRRRATEERLPSKPLPDVDAEKRRKATEEGTYLPAGAKGGGAKFERPETRSVARVPEEWIRTQCDRTSAQLAALTNLLKAGTADQKALTAALADVRASIERLDSPPRPSEAPAPKKGPEKP